MTTWYQTDVLRLPMAGPEDTSALQAAFDDGLAAEDVLAVVSQTEGTGHARTLGSLALSLTLGRALGLAPEEIPGRIPMMMIGMTGGLMSPHHNIFLRREVAAPEVRPEEPRLALGVASTRELEPWLYGTAEQSRLTAEAVKQALDDAGMTPEEVTGVEIKLPAMTGPRLEAASEAGHPVSGGAGAVTTRAKGACALGVAAGLGEVDVEEITDEAIGSRHELHTLRGSVSAGAEQTAVRVLVIGNSRTSVSSLRAGYGVMGDQLDVSGVHQALKGAGIDAGPGPLASEQAARVRQVFVNCGADSVGAVRGRRHTILSDFLAGHSGIQAKAVANAVVASVTGDPMLLASAGAEHQGPLGSNLVNAIVEVQNA